MKEPDDCNCPEAMARLLAADDIQAVALHLLTCECCGEFQNLGGTQEVIDLLAAATGSTPPPEAQELIEVCTAAIVALSMAHALANAREELERGTALVWNAPHGEA